MSLQLAKLTESARTRQVSRSVHALARRAYTPTMVAPTLALAMAMSVSTSALVALPYPSASRSPGVARGAMGFSLTARPASPPRPLPPLKENL